MKTENNPKNRILFCEKKILENLHLSQFANKKIIRIDSPIRAFKSRSVGFKRIPGFVTLLVKVNKGGIDPKIPARGRKPSNIYKKYSRKISKLDIAIQKALDKYNNLKLLKGYFLVENGKQVIFEIILKDPVLIN